MAVTLAFTLYVDVHDAFNLVGHLLLICVSCKKISNVKWLLPIYTNSKRKRDED